MKFCEEIRGPGLVIDLMTAAMILTFPIVVVFLLLEISSHVFYHHAPNWDHFLKFAVRNAVMYLVVTSAWHLWKRRRSSRKSPSSPMA